MNSVKYTCWTYDPVANTWSAPLPISTYDHPGQSGKLQKKIKELKRKREREERDTVREEK